MKALAYADEIVFMLSELFPSINSEIRKRVLRRLYLWAVPDTIPKIIYTKGNKKIIIIIKTSIYDNNKRF